MQSLFTFLLSLCLMLPPSLLIGCPSPNPSVDCPLIYNPSISIEQNFNSARRWEETSNALPSGCLGNMTPPQGGWSALPAKEKILYMIQSERIARNLLPLEGREAHVESISQSHADWLLSHDYYSHIGNPAWGTTCTQAAMTCSNTQAYLGSCPSQRINNNPNLTGCWEALGENIGILQGNSANLSEIIYNMIYRNKQCCNWSYRNNILKIFANNYGDGQHEGLVGVGIAEGSSYNLPFSPTCAGVYAKILTLNFYDPKAQASCAFFSPLPIVLSQFDAQNLSGNQIQLSWKTEMETSFSHFEIERAGEDEDWQTIEKITGQGSPAQGAHYHFLDVSPSCGSLFYRLKAVDINGEYDYSETQKMELDCNISAAWSVTNPLKDHILHVHFSGKTPDSETPYTITDMQGKIIEKGILQKGATELPLKSLPKGIFLFSLKWDAAPAATMRIINHE